jgi:GT2 family glycosyltransferase
MYVERNEPAWKRNIGTNFSQGKYIVYMDDDVEVHQHCIRRMKDILKDNKDIGMVYATLYKMDNHEIVDTSGSFLSWSGFLYETYLKRLVTIIPILSGKSACCMVKKDVFYSSGGFDDDYVIYGEETDLSWRIWQLGYKVVIRNDAVAYHAFETNLKPRSYYNQRYIHYNGCKNYITTLIKNLPPSKMYIAVINFGIWFFMGCCLWVRNRQGGKWIFEGLGYNIKHFSYIWSKRIKIANHSYWKTIRKNPPITYFFGRFFGYLAHKLHG